MKARPRSLQYSVILAIALLAASIPAMSQQSNADAVNSSVVPQIASHAGVAPDRAGETVEMVFNLYSAAEGGEPIWSETQLVSVGQDGKYSVLLGSATQGGLPQAVFAVGSARWLGVTVERGAEQPRVPFTSVAYAMKAADAQTLAGIPAADFVTRQQFSQLAREILLPTQPEPAGIHPETSGTVTGSGTTGTVPLWTGALTQGNSLITQVGSDIGINQTAPTATLDVNGSENVRGILYLPPLATATSTVGQRSQLLQLSASAWSSSTNAAVTPTFKILTNYVNNNTTGAGGQLEFHYSNGPASVSVLSIAGNGVINFSPSQTFPGTIKSVAATSPITAATTSGAVSLGLDAGSLETTLNTVYPQLAAGNNVFTGSASFAGPVTAASTGPNGAVTAGSVTGPGIIGNSQTPGVGASGILGYIGTSPSPQYTSLSNIGTAGVWGDALNNPTVGAPGGADWGAGIVGTASNPTGYGGFFYNSTSVKPAVFADNAGSVTSNLDAIRGGGGGVFGESFTANGVTGQSQSPVGGEAGVFGFTSAKTSSSYSTTASNLFIAGVWGDTAGNPINGAFSAGVIGTSTSNLGYGGYFFNASPDYPAVEAINNLGPGVRASGVGGDGVDGTSSQGSAGAGTGGSGVSGFGASPSAGNGGVVGIVYGASNTFSTFLGTGPGYVAGVWGDAGTSSTGAELYKSGVVGTGDDITAGAFENNSPAAHPTISAVSLDSGPTGLFKTLMATSPNGTCGFGGKGDLSCTGQVKSLVSAGNGARTVETYAMQSPENWMEDFGSGTLERGVAVVKIDPTFADTVSESPDYHVFLTPKGDSKGLYVINETPTSFEVRESGGGTSYLAFDYRIVARRRGYESQRHVDVTEQFKTAMDKSPLNSKPNQSTLPVNKGSQISIP